VTPPALGRRGEGYVALQVACLGLVIVAGLNTPGTRSAATAVLGGLVGVAGAWLGVLGVAGLHAARSMSVLPHPVDGGQLARTGAYAVVRHPIYGGLILMSIGWAVFQASLPTLGAAVLLALVLDLKRRAEEIRLRRRFPDYDAYRQATPRALIPLVY
jgi:protein-S-isoprenylcysteine O-methyltransferase Ste14